MSVNALLQPVQQLVNRGIGESTTAKAQLAQLEGESIQLQLEGLPFELVLVAMEDELLIGGVAPVEPTATLHGTLLGAVKFMRGDETTTSAGLRIDGDAEVAQGFVELLKLARPDFEEELSRITGDIAAHQIGNVFRGAKDFAARAAQTLRANTSEYLQEESEQLPPRIEVEAFYEDLSRLRDGVERAAARLAQLRGSGELAN
ncbi:MAG: SCP2 sterol-binding domain-containing protein [Gammaproteobacteria bacterium]